MKPPLHAVAVDERCDVVITGSSAGTTNPAVSLAKLHQRSFHGDTWADAEATAEDLEVVELARSVLAELPAPG